MQRTTIHRPINAGDFVVIERRGPLARSYWAGRVDQITDNAIAIDHGDGKVRGYFGPPPQGSTQHIHGPLEPYRTGGNCMSLYYQEPDTEAEWLLTRPDDPSIPEEGEPFELNRYPEPWDERDPTATIRGTMPAGDWGRVPA